MISFDCDTLRCHQWLLGHHATDLQLVRIATILKRTFTYDAVFRLSGDEFAVFTASKDVNELKLQQLLNELEDPTAFTDTKKHDSLWKRTINLLVSTNSTPENQLPSFTVSACTSELILPISAIEIRELHDRNVAKIGSTRYAGISHINPASQFPKGKTGILVHNAG